MTTGDVIPANGDEKAALADNGAGGHAISSTLQQNHRSAHKMKQYTDLYTSMWEVQAVPMQIVRPTNSITLSKKNQIMQNSRNWLLLQPE